MTKKRINPMLFVWIPIGLSTGARTEDLAWVHVLLVTLAVLFAIEKICTSQH